MTTVVETDAAVLESESAVTAAALPCALVPGSADVWQRDVSDANVLRGGIVRLGLFCVVALAACVGTDAMVTAGLRRIQTSSFGVFNRLVDGRIDAAILVSGSSRALNHFDPRVITRETGLTAFNIGINGSQTDMQLAVLRTYLKHNAKPRLLVQSLDSFSFVTSDHGVYFPGQYLPYLDQDDIYQALRRVDPDVWKAKHVPLYGYAVEDMNFTWVKGLAALAGWAPREDRFGGFEPREGRWTQDFVRFTEGRRDGVQFEIQPRGVRVFNQLMDLCKDAGIPVLLVYTPVYYEMQSLELNRGALFEQFRAIATRYGAELWDYSESPISLRQEYFVNSQHLNAEGAAVFSAAFARRLAGLRGTISGVGGGAGPRGL